MTHLVKLHRIADHSGKNSFLAVSALIDRNTPINLIVDTGATHTIIDADTLQSFVPEASYNPGVTPVRGVGGKQITTQEVTIPIFQMGECPLLQYVDVLAGKGYFDDIVGVQGLLGMDILGTYSKITFDLTDNVMILEA